MALPGNYKQVAMASSNLIATNREYPKKTSECILNDSCEFCISFYLQNDCELQEQAAAPIQG